MLIKLPRPRSKFTPHYVASKLLFWCSDDDYRVEHLAAKLSCSILSKVIRKIDTVLHSREVVVIEEHDVWDMDQTVAMLVLPMLKELVKQKDSFGRVNPLDCPSTCVSNKERWTYVVNEMIFAFDATINRDPINWLPMEEVRRRTGLRLFGKYFDTLWT